MLATRCLLWAAVTARLALTGKRRTPRWEWVRDISTSSIGVTIYVYCAPTGATISSFYRWPHFLSRAWL